LIQLKNVYKQYLGIRGTPGQLALKDVSLQIPLGTITFLLGSSQAGKSTLLHLIGAMDSCTSGEIWVGEDCLSQMSPMELNQFRKHKIGLLFEALSLTDGLSALENVLVPIIAEGISPIDVENARILLEHVGLGDHLLSLPSEMTEEEQQRVALARSIISTPQIIIADEPTGKLQSSSAAKEFYIYLRKLQEEFGLTFIISTQNPEFIQNNDYVFRLYHGQLLSPAHGEHGFSEEPSNSTVKGQNSAPLESTLPTEKVYRKDSPSSTLEEEVQKLLTPPQPPTAPPQVDTDLSLKQNPTENPSSSPDIDTDLSLPLQKNDSQTPSPASSEKPALIEKLEQTQVFPEAMTEYFEGSSPPFMAPDTPSTEEFGKGNKKTAPLTPPDSSKPAP
jgi:ABC-type lipoprotein export system ATPase subunit